MARGWIKITLSYLLLHILAPLHCRERSTRSSGIEAEPCTQVPRQRLRFGRPICSTRNDGFARSSTTIVGRLRRSWVAFRGAARVRSWTSQSTFGLLSDLAVGCSNVGFISVTDHACAASARRVAAQRRRNCSVWQYAGIVLVTAVLRSPELVRKECSKGRRTLLFDRTAALSIHNVPQRNPSFAVRKRSELR